MIRGHPRVLVLLVVILAFGVSVEPQAQMTRRQQQILHTVINVDGQITREMHRQFWEDWPAVSEGRKVKSAQWLTGSILVARRYQRALWVSALRSYQARRVIRTKELAAAEQAAQVRARNPPYACGSAAWKGFQQAFAERTAISKANERRLLDAASRHGRLRIAGGRRVQVDEAYIRRVLARQETSFKRVKRLLDPVWRGG